MFKSKLIVLLFIFTTTHGLVMGSQREGRVYNGYNARLSEYPYVVLIEADLEVDDEVTSCGGALIAHTWVLTAAHCIDGVAMVTVYLGSVNIDEAKITYKVFHNNFRIHPYYKSAELFNDIALIRIPHTVTCENIAIVALPFIDITYSNYVNSVALFSGWGETSNADYSPVLQGVSLTTISNSLCSHFVKHITSEKICVETNFHRRSPCYGDSGGPLVLESTKKLIGVLSSVSWSGCGKGKPAVFTRVTSFLQWIQSEAGIWY